MYNIFIVVENYIKFLKELFKNKKKMSEDEIILFLTERFKQNIDEIYSKYENNFLTELDEISMIAYIINFENKDIKTREEFISNYVYCLNVFGIMSELKKMNKEVV